MHAPWTTHPAATLALWMLPLGVISRSFRKRETGVHLVLAVLHRMVVRVDWVRVCHVQLALLCLPREPRIACGAGRALLFLIRGLQRAPSALWGRMLTLRGNQTAQRVSVGNQHWGMGAILVHLALHFVHLGHMGVNYCWVWQLGSVFPVLQGPSQVATALFSVVSALLDPSLAMVLLHVLHAPLEKQLLD